MRILNVRLSQIIPVKTDPVWIIIREEEREETMELKVLENFLVVADEQNISRAARRLNISQPSLSRQLATLESELSVQLFDRGRKIELTEAGRKLAAYARQITALANKAREDISKQEEITGEISIGCNGLHLAALLPDIMRDFQLMHPGIRFRLQTDSAQSICDCLENGELDFGMLLEPIDISKLDYIRIQKQEYWGLLIRSDHPLAQKETIQAEDLYALRLMVPEDDSLKKELENWMRISMNELDILGTFNVISNAASLVQSGWIGALTIEAACVLFDERKLAFRRLNPALTEHSVVAWKASHGHSRAVDVFAKYLQNYAFNA